MSAPEPAVALELRDVAKRFQAGGRTIDALRGVGFRVRGGVVSR